MGKCWAALAFAATALAQGERFDVVLRDGSVAVARTIAGSPATGFELELGAGRRHVAAADLLAVCGPPVLEAVAPGAYLAGGDVVFGDLAGGDAAGNYLELVSPVLGRVRIAADRLAALANPGLAAPLRLPLPAGVSEALFVRVAVGYDTIAGTLHQFGEPGVRFQPEGAAAPRWFGRGDFAALRLAEAVPRASQAPVQLLTRTGDRLGVSLQRWSSDTCSCELESGTIVSLRPQDVAALVFSSGAVFLSDLEPAKLDESGFEGDVVYPLQRDRNVLGGPLVSSGRSYGKGLGVHARSRVSFTVPANCERFWTRVGFDDSTTTLWLEPRAEVRVLVGNAVVFEQKDMVVGQPVCTTGLLAVKPGDTVTLSVDYGRGRDLGDRINWLLPMFLPAARRP